MADKLLGRKSNATDDFLHPFEGSLDAKDPIFDSESEADVLLEEYQPTRLCTESGAPPEGLHSSYSRRLDTNRALVTKEPLSFQEFVHVVTTKLLPDAFAGEDSGAVCEALKALGSSVYHDDFVVRAVRASLDLPVEKQQWMSGLLTILYDTKIITRMQFNRSFEKLVQQSTDIQLDAPDAHRKLFIFFRCGVDDGVILPSFLLRLPESFLTELIQSLKNVDSSNEDEINSLEAQLSGLRKYKMSVDNFVVSQFVTSGSLDDLQPLLLELGHPEFKHEMVRSLLKAAMGRTNVERECLSACLSDAFGHDASCLSPDDILVGFVRTLGEIDEIKIDVPDAPTLLAKFIVRALADEILPPVFVLDAMRLGVGGVEGRAVMRTVKKWIVVNSNGKPQFSQFQKVWIAANPDREETRHFKKQVCDIILEHFADTDFDATQVAIEDLEMTPDQVPDFIRKTFELAMERTEREQKIAVELLSHFVKLEDIDRPSIVNALKLLRSRLPEILLDLPKADTILDRITAMALDYGLLSETKQDEE